MFEVSQDSTLIDITILAEARLPFTVSKRVGGTLPATSSTPMP